MTDRDEKVVEFISKCPCYSNTIQKIFYPSRTIANRRLTYLTNYGYLKRYREHSHEFYFYYTKKKPKQMKHSDCIARVYKWILDQDYKINKYDVQKKYNDIIPDLICEIERDGKRNIIPCEVELSNNIVSNKLEKYECSKYKKVIWVSDHQPASDTIEIIWIELKSLLEL